MLTLYTRDNCTTCEWSKQFLTSNSIEYSEQKIGPDISLEDIKKLFPSSTHLPIIVLNGQVTDMHTVAQQLLTEG